MIGMLFASCGGVVRLEERDTKHESKTIARNGAENRRTKPLDDSFYITIQKEERDKMSSQNMMIGPNTLSTERKEK